MHTSLSISAPGRICLFGEHQDYLGLPVIAAAISLRLHLAGSRRSDQKIRIEMPDIQHTESFNLEKRIPYHTQRDYFKSVLNLLQLQNVEFSKGFDVRLTSNIPINAGTSSSSALVVAWTYFLSQMADTATHLSPLDLADIAYRAEVEEFGEPGGRMDQTSIATGNVIYLESKPVPFVEQLNPIAGTFVLGDSQQAKDTIGILKRVKVGMIEAIRKINSFDSSFLLRTFPYERAHEYSHLLSPDELLLLKGNLLDRDLLLEAKRILQSQHPSPIHFGELLSLHQNNLRDAKKISTPKIDRMIDAAMNAGALGAKINGSGGGGCMFAYAPENPEAVAEAIEKQGGKSYIITIDEGVRTEKLLQELR